MKKFALLAAVVGMMAASSSQAEGTRFDELASLFARGEVPKEGDALGWYSGRCYRDGTPNQAMAGMLAGISEPGAGNDGPLFPGTNVRKFIPLDYGSASPDAFDTLTPQLEAEISSMLNGLWPQTPETSVIDQSLAMDHDAITRWNLRKADGYLVLQVVRNRSAKIYCYYFKKLK
jgi:hypothetical protein